MGFVSDLLKGIFGIAKEVSKTRVKREDVDAISKQTIDEVVRSTFTDGYEIKTNVDISTLGSYTSTYSYTYMVYDSVGNAKIAILIVPHNGASNRNFYVSKEACQNNNIPFVHFYSHMKNEREYVEARIKNCL